MTKAIENIIDENGIELTVSYEYEKTRIQVETFHGPQEVGPTIYTEIKFIQLCVKGGKDILIPLAWFSQDQLQHINSLLNP